MTVTLHKFEGPAHFERLRERSLRSMGETARLVAEGKGDLQACYRHLCEGSLELACIALILDRGDEEARQFFKDAEDYAPRWLRVLGSTGAPRAFEVNVEASESGVRPTAVHEMVRPREPRRLTITDFDQILTVVAMLGDRSLFAEIGNSSEELYRNPNIVAGAEYFTHLRALKAYLRGRTIEAQEMAKAALTGYRENAPAKPGVAAFLCLVSDDALGFRSNIERRLLSHKKEFQRKPNFPSGRICFQAMMLCRLALDRGIEVQDSDYLPLRFLPNLAGKKLH